MRDHAIARSISRPVWERLQERAFHGRVLAVFRHACNLVTSDAEVVALVTPQIGDGPLNVVVAGGLEDLAGIDVGLPVKLRGRSLQVGGREVSLDTAVLWEPHPNWSTLRARRATIAGRLPLLGKIARPQTPAGSLLGLTSSWGRGDTPPTEVGSLGDRFSTTARDATQLLRAGWKGDKAGLQEGAVRLAGLGAGLTPAGDDFLGGVMLWAWLAHPTPGAFCRLLVEVAAPRTTTLSAALLRAAARGECSAPWHRLLTALGTGGEHELAAVVREVLTHGATSGADVLAGFLWMASY